MSAVDDILQSIPMDQLASQLGTDPSTAQQAAGQAVTALLGGIHDNAQTPEGEQALAQALSGHQGSNLLDGGVNLAGVDTNDGERILQHVFGGQNDQVVQALSNGSALNQGMVQKLLPILAPIVLAYLARHMGGGKYGNVLGPILAGGAAGGGANVLSQILGGVLGGGGALGGGLGGLLGGSQAQAQTSSMPDTGSLQAPESAQQVTPGFNEEQSGQSTLGVGPGGLTMGDDSSVAPVGQDATSEASVPQSGGMQAGGIQPGGMQSGGMQSGGMQPGGVLGQILGGLFGGR